MMILDPADMLTDIRSHTEMVFRAWRNPGLVSSCNGVSIIVTSSKIVSWENAQTAQRCWERKDRQEQQGMRQRKYQRLGVGLPDASFEEGRCFGSIQAPLFYRLAACRTAQQRRGARTSDSNVSCLMSFGCSRCSRRRCSAREEGVVFFQWGINSLKLALLIVWDFRTWVLK